MSDYLYQTYPRVKYHPKHPPKTVQNNEEEKALGSGWYDTPNDFPKPSRAVTYLDTDAKAWWNRWEWLVGAVIKIGTGIALIWGFFRLVLPFVKGFIGH
jgi:hypothetical protein